MHDGRSHFAGAARPSTKDTETYPLPSATARSTSSVTKPFWVI